MLFPLRYAPRASRGHDANQQFQKSFEPIEVGVVDACLEAGPLVDEVVAVAQAAAEPELLAPAGRHVVVETSHAAAARPDVWKNDNSFLQLVCRFLPHQCFATFIYIIHCKLIPKTDPKKISALIFTLCWHWPIGAA